MYLTSPAGSGNPIVLISIIRDDVMDCGSR